MENITLIIFLLFGISFLGILSYRYRFPFPIVLVLCGVLLSIVPGLPVITMSPDIVFLIFLPPLLYSGAWNTSWHEFKAAIRPISLAAVGLVILTTVAVAVVAHYFIPGLSWPLAFVIGAIVSPPDAVAATSVTSGLKLYPRLITVLEGESLVNDASGLICYKYALSAVMVGNFVVWEAGLNFVIVAIAGIAIGLAIGYALYLIHKRFVCDPVIEVVLTFLTPFASYLLAEHFHFSGVLAVVTTGLYLSYRSAEMFSHQSRIMAYSTWEVVIFILNGLIFILIGLQLRVVLEGLSEYPLSDLLLWAAIISAIVILIRFLWVAPVAVIPEKLISKSGMSPPLDNRNLVVFAWAGMSGVVSMAAALALPVMLPDGSSFPHRNLIIFLVFCVILSTLVLLGLTLPWVIRRLKIPAYSVDAEEYEVRTKVVSQTIGHIEDNLSLIEADLLRNIKTKYEVKYNRLQKTELPSNYFAKGQTLSGSVFNEYTKLQIDLIAVEREVLQRLHREGQTSQEIIRKMERELDLEQTRLNMEMY